MTYEEAEVVYENKPDLYLCNSLEYMACILWQRVAVIPDESRARKTWGKVVELLSQGASLTTCIVTVANCYPDVNFQYGQAYRVKV